MKLSITKKPLISDGYTLEMTPERLGWLEPTIVNLSGTIEGEVSPEWLPMVEGILRAGCCAGFPPTFVSNARTT